MRETLRTDIQIVVVKYAEVLKQLCYFKRIENTLKKYMRQLKQTVSDSEKANLKAKIAVLQEILAYIKLGEWTDSKKAHERVMYTLKNGVEASAKHYSTTENCIYAGLSKASTKVQQKVGKDVLRLINDGETEFARFLFYRNTKQLGKLLLDSVVEVLPMECTADVALDDCANEIKHLRMYTPWFVDKVAVSKCDKDKLAYIRRLLTTQDDTIIKQQFELYKKLKSNVLS